MKTSKKVKMLARVGQIMYWVFWIMLCLFEEQLPMYEQTVYSGTVAEIMYMIIGLMSAVILSEAIVRVIGYFAELLDK